MDAQDLGQRLEGILSSIAYRKWDRSKRKPRGRSKKRGCKSIEQWRAKAAKMEESQDFGLGIETMDERETKKFTKVGIRAHFGKNRRKLRKKSYKLGVKRVAASNEKERKNYIENPNGKFKTYMLECSDLFQITT